MIPKKNYVLGIGFGYDSQKKYVLGVGMIPKPNTYNFWVSNSILDLDTEMVFTSLNYHPQKEFLIVRNIYR